MTRLNKVSKQHKSNIDTFQNVPTNIKDIKQRK